MSDKRILLTGASGFVGQALLSRLVCRKSCHVVAASRTHVVSNAPNVTSFSSGEISDATDWSEALVDIDCVIHLANAAHRTCTDMEFDRINVEGTLNLARQALNSGVRRFIFISSIGVNGVQTHSSAFDELSIESPAPGYAISKWQAEEKLRALADGSAMEWVIIRPPLVYAANAPGNFGRLLKLVNAGMPLPLGAIDNRRSLVALENLVDFILFCINKSGVKNQVFLISDGVDLSTPDIVRLLAKGADKKPLLFPVPVALLKLGAFLLGRRGIHIQLCSSLRVNSSKVRSLGWKPIVDGCDAITAAGRNYKNLSRP